MDFQHSTVRRPTESVLVTNKVLRNTYLLLALTLGFSAITAGVAMICHLQMINPLIFIVGYFGLLYMTNRLQNSGAGIIAVFALTGFMGFYLGPILNLYIHGFQNGEALVMTALGGTGLIFLVMSMLATRPGKDFSYMSSFITTGIIVTFICSLVAILFHLSTLALIVSGAFMILSSCIILYYTNAIVHGGETNYIRATVVLYVQLFNLFLSLLQILGLFSDRR